MVYRLIRALLAVPLIRLLLRPRVRGIAAVPRTGPVLLAANHLSLVDPVLISTVVPRPISYVVKSEYFTGSGPRGAAVAAFFRAIHQVPLDRSGGTRSDAALATARRLLSAGEAVGIFPEGTRSPDGLLHRGRTGVARIALATGVPVVPVGVIGTAEVLAPHSSRVHRHRPTLEFGPPLRFPVETDPGRERLREVTDQVVAAIAALSGQQRTDTDARAAGAVPPGDPVLDATGPGSATA